MLQCQRVFGDLIMAQLIHIADLVVIKNVCQNFIAAVCDETVSKLMTGNILMTSFD